MNDSIFNTNMTSSQARIALYTAVEGKTEEEKKQLLAEYDAIRSVILKRELKLAEEGWCID